MATQRKSELKFLPFFILFYHIEHTNAKEMRQIKHIEDAYLAGLHSDLCFILSEFSCELPAGVKFDPLLLDHGFMCKSQHSSRKSSRCVDPNLVLGIY